MTDATENMFKRHQYKITVGGALLVAIFTWHQLGWDTLYLTSEAEASELRLIAQMQEPNEFAKQTRKMLLNDDWWQKQSQIEEYNSQPQTPAVKELIIKLKQEQDDIKSNIAKLK